MCAAKVKTKSANFARKKYTIVNKAVMLIHTRPRAKILYQRIGSIRKLCDAPKFKFAVFDV